MTLIVRHQLWQQGDWVIEYRSECPKECMNGGACVLVDHNTFYGMRKCWHERRFFSRNRTLMECLCEALDYVAKRNEEESAAKDQAAMLAEEAQALAEAAQSLASLSRA